MSEDRQLPSFVIAATLAGHVYRMRNTAKLMLISASNAKGLVSRVGDRALGFRPITDFIVDMANDTIHYANKINTLALAVSQLSVAATRALDGERRMARAGEQLEHPLHTEFIKQLIGRTHEHQTEMLGEINGFMSQLDMQLDEIQQRVRGATLVVSTSRTEASRAGEFRKYLDSIADSVESAAGELQREIVQCRKLIESLRKLTKADRQEHHENRNRLEAL